MKSWEHLTKTHRPHPKTTEGEIMGRPSIGAAVTPTIEKERKTIVKELTVLAENSKESIYSLVFSETKEGGMNNHE